jgi:hypothetical protein
MKMKKRKAMIMIRKIPKTKRLKLRSIMKIKIIIRREEKITFVKISSVIIKYLKWMEIETYLKNLSFISFISFL